MKKSGLILSTFAAAALAGADLGLARAAPRPMRIADAILIDPIIPPPPKRRRKLARAILGDDRTAGDHAALAAARAKRERRRQRNLALAARATG